MSLADWDRKTRTLAQVIDRSLGDFRKRKKPALTKMQELSEQIAERQRAFEFMMEQLTESMTSQLLVSEQQKAMLHWARKWAQQFAELYYMSRNLHLFTLWCQLLYVRCTSLPTFLQNATSYSALGLELRRYKEFLNVRREELVRQVSLLAERREVLVISYHTTLVSAVNRQALAAAPLQKSFPIPSILQFDPNSAIDDERVKLELLTL